MSIVFFLFFIGDWWCGNAWRRIAHTDDRDRFSRDRRKRFKRSPIPGAVAAHRK